MNALAVVAIIGWACAASLALVLARRRALALQRAAHQARVTHELRGPLHAAGLILAGVGVVEAAAGALAALQVELGRVALAVADLDDGLRRPRRAGTAAAHRTGRPAPCDVAGLVRTLTVGWQAQARAVGTELHLHACAQPAWVCAEPLRLAQALGNLVANALEHGAGPVDVRVRRGGASAVLVEVCDRGPGLPAAVATLSRRCVDPTARHGHGLGIASGIAEAAGGRLSAGPTGHGARLVLALPPAEADRPHGRRSRSSQATAPPTRPLVS